MDRAEYSLQETTIVIALVIGGVTLTAMGALRLRAVAFHEMPRRVAVAITVGGVAVIAFGVALLFVTPGAEQIAAPRATLEPVDEGADRPPSASGVVGRVVTSGGGGVEGETVTLRPLFNAEGAEARKTKTDTDGTFRFPKVKVDPGSPYVAEVSYGGARFTTEILRAPRDETSNLRVVVARSTRSKKGLAVKGESLAIVGDEAGLQAVHALNIDNTTERAFAGALELPLLRGAAAIQEGPGLDRRRLELRDGAMISGAPLVPGPHDVSYTYVTQMSSDGIPVSRTVALPTARFELLVAGDLDFEPSERLRASSEVKLGPRDAQRTYRRYVATNLEPGDRVRGRIVVAEGAEAIRIAAPVAAVVVALALLAFGLLRRRRATPRPAPEPEPAETTT